MSEDNHTIDMLKNVPSQAHTGFQISTFEDVNSSHAQAYPESMSTLAMGQQGMLENDFEANLRMWRSELNEVCRAIDAKLRRQIELQDLISRAQRYLNANDQGHEQHTVSANHDMSGTMSNFIPSTNHSNAVPNAYLGPSLPGLMVDQSYTSYGTMRSSQTTDSSIFQDRFQSIFDLALDIPGTNAVLVDSHRPPESQQQVTNDTLGNGIDGNSDFHCGTLSTRTEAETATCLSQESRQRRNLQSGGGAGAGGWGWGNSAAGNGFAYPELAPAPGRALAGRRTTLGARYTTCTSYARAHRKPEPTNCSVMDLGAGFEMLRMGETEDIEEMRGRYTVSITSQARALYNA
ncbi:MAG: hypothetical protein Q9191_005504 [Dirinaria sp. TL-2023a]